MSDLRELYEEVIKDHDRHPRNCHPMPEASHTAEGHNRLCGDRMTLFAKIENGVIRDLSFQGRGCAIATASASLMTETLKGKTVQEALALFEKFHDVLTGPPDEEPPDDPSLGKLAAFAGVREYPIRVKCATLIWHTLQAALKDQKQPVSTE